MFPPPLPSTSHFPPPFEQVAPKSTSNKEGTNEPSIIVAKTPEIPKEKEVSPTNIETDKKYKTEEENSRTVLNGKISGPDIELDALAENHSIAMKKVEETEAIGLQELPADAEKESIITEIESAMSEINGLTYAAEQEGKLCQEAIDNHSALVEKVLEKAVGDDNDADDGTWKDVFDAANQKTDHLGKAQVSQGLSY